MRKTVVVSAKRTPIGNFGGVFKDYSAVKLGVAVLKAILEETGVKSDQLDEVILGNVCGCGYGQNVARQVAIYSDVPNHIPAYTVNKVCGSGMKAVTLGALMISAGEADIIVAGGIENMSQIPFASMDTRWGGKMGNKELVDLMIRDGLSDIFNNCHMGITAENLAERNGITREQQDVFAVESHRRASEAQAAGRFADEIVPVPVKVKRETVDFVDDEHIRHGADLAAMAKLPAAFKKDGTGTVTAGNASGMNDAGAALVLMSADKAAELLRRLAQWGSPVLIRRFNASGTTRTSVHRDNTKTRQAYDVLDGVRFKSQTIGLGSDKAYGQFAYLEADHDG